LAARPFDRARDGAVFGEGSGVLVLEERAHAEARGANIVARVRASSSRFEPHGPGRPLTGSAIRHSIEAALAKAGLQPQDIGHVNAHGEGTVAADRCEAQAIHETLGDVPVTAPKSYFGDLGSGSGAVEMIASVLALQHGRIPRTLNYKQPDAECPINVVAGVSREIDKPTALILNQAHTGQAVAVLIDVP
jgi:3-oxoacyl-[acyl-carrier-protein] synthase II